MSEEINCPEDYICLTEDEWWEIVEDYEVVNSQTGRYERVLRFKNFMNTDGTKEKNLTNSESNEFNPVFSPVDEKIAYVSDRSGNDDIYLYDIKTNKLKKISNSDSNESLPKFSLDGDYIAYISDKENILKVYCYNIKTSKITNIVKSPYLSGASFDFYQVK